MTNGDDFSTTVNTGVLHHCKWKWTQNVQWGRWWSFCRLWLFGSHLSQMRLNLMFVSSDEADPCHSCGTTDPSELLPRFGHSGHQTFLSFLCFLHHALSCTVSHMGGWICAWKPRNKISVNHGESSPCQKTCLWSWGGSQVCLPKKNAKCWGSMVHKGHKSIVFPLELIGFWNFKCFDGRNEKKLTPYQLEVSLEIKIISHIGKESWTLGLNHAIQVNLLVFILSINHIQILCSLLHIWHVYIYICHIHLNPLLHQNNSGNCFGHPNHRSRHLLQGWIMELCLKTKKHADSLTHVF